MTFTVELQSTDGRRVASASDTHDFVHSVACELPESVIAGANPYDDTELAGSNLDRFRSEWEEAKSIAVSDFEHTTWKQVRDMAARAAMDPELRLVVLGD